jgi:hypothetical protein
VHGLLSCFISLVRARLNLLHFADFLLRCLLAASRSPGDCVMRQHGGLVCQHALPNKNKMCPSR